MDRVIEQRHTIGKVLQHNINFDKDITIDCEVDFVIDTPRLRSDIQIMGAFAYYLGTRDERYIITRDGRKIRIR